MSKLKVINLFSGPGAGKSRTRGRLFGELLGVNMEDVSEYAKQLVWEERYKSLENQLEIISEQYRRQHMLVGKVDLIVTDSPLLLSIIYRNEDTPRSLEPMILELWNQFDNYNFFLDRSSVKYDTVGRMQNEKEAREIDKDILAMLRYQRIPYHEVKTGDNVTHEITRHLRNDVVERHGRDLSDPDYLKLLNVLATHSAWKGE